MKKYKIASILMIIHGGFIELGGCLAIIPVLIFGSDKIDITKPVTPTRKSSGAEVRNDTPVQPPAERSKRRSQWGRLHEIHARVKFP